MTSPTNGGGSVSKNWLIGILTTLTLLGGGGWLTALHGQVSDIKRDQATDKDKRAEQATSVKVIEEKVRRLEQDAADIKNEQREQGRKLDELLRRVR